MPSKRRYDPTRGVDTWLVWDDIMQRAVFNDEVETDWQGNLTTHPTYINPQELPFILDPDDYNVPNPRPNPFGEGSTLFDFDPYSHVFTEYNKHRFGFEASFILYDLFFEDIPTLDEDKAIYFWISSDADPSRRLVTQPIIDMDSAVRQELPESDMLSWMIPELDNKRLIIAYKEGAINILSFDFNDGFNQIQGFEKISFPFLNTLNNTNYEILFSRFIDHDAGIVNIHAREIA